MNGFNSIAIDGPAGAGKSSLARRLSKELGYIYVDTGAIYRSVGLAAHRRGLDTKDETAVSAMLPEINIEIRYNDEGEQRMFLDGEDVSAEIRLPEISICASNVSAMPAVRVYLLEMQRSMARAHNVIMDGRDIGTVVLPDAELKIFLTASAAARAQRRLLELQGKGVKADYDEGSARYRIPRQAGYQAAPAAPLKAADDAVRVDTSDIDFEQSAALLRSIVRERLGI